MSGRSDYGTKWIKNTGVNPWPDLMIVECEPDWEEPLPACEWVWINTTLNTHSRAVPDAEGWVQNPGFNVWPNDAVVECDTQGDKYYTDVSEQIEWFDGCCITRSRLAQQPSVTTPEEDEAFSEIESKRLDELVCESQKLGLYDDQHTAAAFATKAADLLAERGKTYDRKGSERSMGRTVAAFNSVTGRDLTEWEGWLLMSLLKRVRQASAPEAHRDSAEDAVAYACLEAECLMSQREVAK